MKITTTATIFFFCLFFTITAIAQGGGYVKINGSLGFNLTGTRLKEAVPLQKIWKPDTVATVPWEDFRDSFNLKNHYTRFAADVEMGFQGEGPFFIALRTGLSPLAGNFFVGGLLGFDLPIEIGDGFLRPRVAYQGGFDMATYRGDPVAKFIRNKDARESAGKTLEKYSQKSLGTAWYHQIDLGLGYSYPIASNLFLEFGANGWIALQSPKRSKAGFHRGGWGFQLGVKYTP